MIVFGVSNDMAGYVVPPNDFILHPETPYFENGHDIHDRRHYEETNSLGPKTAVTIADTVKEMLYARFALPVVSASEAAPYTFRFPDNPDIFSDVEAKQLGAEELVEKVVNGRVKLQWDARKRRNEALDCLVYAYAALRISVQRWQLDLDALARARRDEQDDDEMTIEEIAAALSGG